MKKIVTIAMGFILAITVQALELPELITNLSSEDYALRKSSRAEMQKTFAEASKPNADGASRLALEQVLCEALKNQANSDAKIWITRILGNFGSDNAIPSLEALFSDESEEVQDAARLALMGNPSNLAIKSLRNGFSAATGKQKLSFIDSLVYVNDVKAAPAIAKLLKSADEATAIAAANGLAKLKHPGALKPLLSKLANSSGELRESIELAILSIGLPSSAASLVTKGSTDSVRAGAFQQLLNIDEANAVELFSAVMNQLELSGREDIARLGIVSGISKVENILVSTLSSTNNSDKLIVLSGIADAKLSNYESTVLPLIHSGDWQVAQRAIFTLGEIGGQASYDALYAKYQNKPEDSLALAISKIDIPAMDAQLFKTVSSSGDATKRFAALKLLAIRNPEGTVKQLNTLASPNESAEIRKAAFVAMEAVGSFESAKILASAIILNDELMRPAQKSLKKLCENLGAPDSMFSDVFKPAIDSATSDEARIGLLVILDGVAGAKAEAYLKSLLTQPESGLHKGAVSSLSRWSKFSAGKIWLEMAKQPEVYGVDLATAQKGLARVISRKEIDAHANDKLKLGQKAIEEVPDPEFQKAIVSAFKLKNFVGWQSGNIKKWLNGLLDDEVLRAAAREALGMPPLAPEMVQEDAA